MLANNENRSVHYRIALGFLLAALSQIQTVFEAGKNQGARSWSISYAGRAWPQHLVLQPIQRRKSQTQTVNASKIPSEQHLVSMAGVLRTAHFQHLCWWPDLCSQQEVLGTGTAFNTSGILLSYREHQFSFGPRCENLELQPGLTRAIG